MYNDSKINTYAACADGYRDGYRAGKLCAARQILDELEEAFTQKREELKQNRDLYPEVDFPESKIYWQGRSLTCLELLQYISKLRKKYEIGD